jgi:hypothetical protein
MHVRRLIAALAALAPALTLGFPLGQLPAQAVIGDMPCHSEQMPIPGNDSDMQPPCCVPMCWAFIEPRPSVPTVSAKVYFVQAGKVAFASLSVRPRLPPPRS